MDNEQKNYLLGEAARKALQESDGKQPVQIIVREGKANDVKEPHALQIYGTIDTPARHIAKRKEDILVHESHIEVNREEMSIGLILDEHSAYEDHIVGRLQLSQDYQGMGINDGEYVSCFDLADRIKKYRTLFESREAAMKLVSELRNFKAKVEREMELSDDKRGNVNIRKNQAVDSNIPEALKVHLQIFKGQPAETFEVEVEVNPNDLSMTLVSPEANDIIRDQRDIIINRQLDAIGKMAPGILIIEK
jgi:hypothetical protein